MIKKIVAVGAVLGAVVLFRPAPAHAGFSFSFFLPGLAVAAGRPCPPPVAYLPPAPAYYYAPEPVVYVHGYYPGPPVYRGYGSHGRHGSHGRYHRYKHRHSHHGW